jgi:hypothetical protein
MSGSFGYAVDVSGDHIAVSDPAPEVGAEGTVYVFSYDQDQSLWINTFVASAADGSPGNQFGAAVALDGDILAVGATGDGEQALDAGAVYIFRFDGDGWSQEDKLLASDGISGDQFGDPLALSGDRCVVGVPTRDVGAHSNVGVAYVFSDMGGTWTEEQQLVPTVTSNFLSFATAVAVSGDVIAVGVTGTDVGVDCLPPPPFDCNMNQGTTEVYRYDSEASMWTIEQTIHSPIMVGAGIQFGRGVALDANRLAVIGNLSHLYEYSEGTWNLSASLLAGASPPNTAIAPPIDMHMGKIITDSEFSEVGVIMFDIDNDAVDEDFILVLPSGVGFYMFELANLRTAEVFIGMCIEENEFLQNIGVYDHVPPIDAPTSTPHVTPLMANLLAEYWEEFFLGDEFTDSQANAFRNGAMELIVDQNDGPSSGDFQGQAGQPPYSWLAALDGTGPGACLQALTTLCHQDLLREFTPATPEECDDGNPCTTDDCEGALGCAHTCAAEGAPCDAGGIPNSGICTAECTCSTLCPGGTIAECADRDNDGLRDDPCTWYECDAGVCVLVGRTSQADIGGSFGECPVDTACDGNDRFHALNCFSNKNTHGGPPYPCEANTPYALNVDAGGPESCILDSVCDGWDAFHALNCFEDDWFDGSLGYRCGCVCDQFPEPVPAPPPAARQTAALTLDAPMAVRPGELLAVEVYLEGALEALRGYQLHLEAGGGKSDAPELVDIAVDVARRDYVFAGEPTWSAFNQNTGQMLVGMDAPEGVPAAAGAYLATFTYRVPRDAAGAVVIEIRYGGATAGSSERTFLFGPYAGLVDVTAADPIRVRVQEKQVR